MLFNNLSQNDYSISLNSAHRIKSDIAQSAKDYRTQLSMFDQWGNVWNMVPISDILTKETSQIMEQLEGGWIRNLNDIQLGYALNIDMNRMKECIFEANIFSNISRLLNEVKNLKFEQMSLKGYQKEAQEPDLSKRINSLRDYYQNKETINEHHVLIDYDFHDSKGVKERIKEINRQILDDEEKIAELNTSYRLTVTLYDLTAEEIGLR